MSLFSVADILPPVPTTIPRLLTPPTLLTLFQIPPTVAAGATGTNGAPAPAAPTLTTTGATGTNGAPAPAVPTLTTTTPTTDPTSTTTKDPTNTFFSKMKGAMAPFFSFSEEGAALCLAIFGSLFYVLFQGNPTFA